MSPSTAGLEAAGLRPRPRRRAEEGQVRRPVAPPGPGGGGGRGFAAAVPGPPGTGVATAGRVPTRRMLRNKCYNGTPSVSAALSRSG